MVRLWQTRTTAAALVVGTAIFNAHIALVDAVSFGITPRMPQALESRSLSARAEPGRISRIRPASVDLDSTGGQDVDGDGEHSVVDNVANIRWTTTITLSGKEYEFLLDTGSRDLWLDLSRDKPDFNDTGIPISLRYGDGSYGVDGTIGITEFTVGDTHIKDQAFLAATKNTIGSTTELNVDGLLGLQFDLSSSSSIGKAMKAKYGKSTTKGRTLLENIFRQNESLPNYIAFDLGRSDDFEELDDGFFTIGEHSPKAEKAEIEGVEGAKAIKQFPEGGASWTALVEKITIGGVPVELKSMLKGTPKGKVVALLDTGAPKTTMSEELWDAIYGGIEGAGQLKGSAKQPGQWQIPCMTTASLVITLGGQDYPMHPLDLSEIEQGKVNGEPHTRCMSTLKPSVPSRWKNKAYEMILGADFLMNVYAMFDFGDFQKNGKLGRPYMKLYSQIDPKKAASQVQSIRGERMKSMPPELLPKPTPKKKPGKNSTVDAATFPNFGWVNAEGGVLMKYAAAGLALMGLNVLLGIVIVVGGVVLLRKRRRAGRVDYSRVEPKEVVFSAD